MEEFEKKESFEREDIFSKAVRAGKRTYYFDVKSTKNDDYYITITERKRRYDQEGNFKVEKHKVFLYKEDFDKFSTGLSEVINFIKTNKGESELVMQEDTSTEKNFTDVDFDDLDK